MTSSSQRINLVDTCFQRMCIFERFEIGFFRVMMGDNKVEQSVPSVVDYVAECMSGRFAVNDAFMIESSSKLYPIKSYQVIQGKNITLPERLGQVNFDCGQVDFCCIPCILV